METQRTKALESRWSHHRPRVDADECWVFARVRHDADRARVTALNCRADNFLAVLQLASACILMRAYEVQGPFWENALQRGYASKRARKGLK